MAFRRRSHASPAQRIDPHFTTPADATARKASFNREPARPAAGEQSPAGKREQSKTSLALANLRGIVILVVVAFHSSLAYLAFLGPRPFAFDAPPYEWRAFPIVDNHRWLGFDIFCAWQDVYLMAFMFFLSALFTWSSLTRKGGGKFLADRFLRLGLPFAFALIVMAPLALYPTWRVTAADPSFITYARHYVSLPFIPNGPAWFLWQLLALTVAAAGLHRFAPGFVAVLARASASAAAHPGRYFLALLAAAIVAYVPPAVVYTPMAWADSGPLGLQYSRVLLYAVFYLAGLGLGAPALDRGLLSPEGKLAERWIVWLACALVSFLLWMGLTGLEMSYRGSGPLVLQVVVDSSFALACASGCFFVLAACLRFGTRQSRILSNLSSNAFGIYLVHYMFVVWLQYALLGVALFAFAKGMMVFAGALSLAWATTAALRRMPIAARLIGEDGPPRRDTSAPGFAYGGRRLAPPHPAGR